jgi:hypothetical protein
MADSIKDRVADAAKAAGNAIAEGAKDAKDWVAEKTGMGQKEGCAPGSGRVEERMDVIASCGKKVGVVDHVEGGAIKLTRKDSPDGQHHFIPMGWVDHVDSHVHLKKNSMETEQGWKADATSCGSCGA